MLQYAAKYRSKARIPALTYLHRTNYVSPVPRFRIPGRLTVYLREASLDLASPWSG